VKYCEVCDQRFALAGFFHVYGGETNYSTLLAPIFSEQLHFLADSELLEKTDELRVTYVGVESNHVTIDKLLAASGAPTSAELLEKLAKVRIHERHRMGHEIITLEALWQFCQNSSNAERRVYYIHSKGSYSPSLDNDVLRRNLMHAVASPCCHGNQTGGDVCGFRVCPTPHLHYPGNMWTAACRHVSRLVSPRDFSTIMSKIHKLVPECYEGAVGAGRFSAEHWIASYPGVIAVDILPVEIGPTPHAYYCWGYARIKPPSVFTWQPTCETFPRTGLRVDPHLLSAYGWHDMKQCTAVWAKMYEYTRLYGDEWFSAVDVDSRSTPCRWFNMTRTEAHRLLTRDNTPGADCIDSGLLDVREYLFGYQGLGEIMLKHCFRGK